MQAEQGASTTFANCDPVEISTSPMKVGNVALRTPHHLQSNTYTYKGAYIVTELRAERDAASVLSNGNGTLNSALGEKLR